MKLFNLWAFRVELPIVVRLRCSFSAKSLKLNFGNDFPPYSCRLSSHLDRFLYFSISFSQFRLVSGNFNQFQSVWLGQNTQAFIDNWKVRKTTRNETVQKLICPSVSLVDDQSLLPAPPGSQRSKWGGSNTASPSLMLSAVLAQRLPSQNDQKCISII